MARYYELKELESRSPRLFGIPTGTKLDEMFFKIEVEDGKYIKKPLGGLPYLSVMNITGAVSYTHLTLPTTERV